MKDNEEMEKEEELSAAGGEGQREAAQIMELPEEEMLRLKGELEAKAKEAEENYGRFLRSAAELDNYRKRAEKEKAEFKSFANEALISEILPVVDNLERALMHAGSGDADSLRKGVELTIGNMYSVLKKYGLEEVASVGQKFDPSVHHAISHEDAGEAGAGTVVTEFLKGYRLKGRLIRPAMVAVGRDAGDGKAR